jgi:hypothetical protein
VNSLHYDEGPGSALSMDLPSMDLPTIEEVLGKFEEGTGTPVHSLRCHASASHSSPVQEYREEKKIEKGVVSTT